MMRTLHCCSYSYRSSRHPFLVLVRKSLCVQVTLNSSTRITLVDSCRSCHVLVTCRQTTDWSLPLLQQEPFSYLRRLYSCRLQYCWHCLCANTALPILRLVLSFFGNIAMDDGYLSCLGENHTIGHGGICL